MSDMVEQVARALCRLQCERNRRQEWIDEAAMDRAVDCSWPHWEPAALVAIQAMVAPTEGMVEAAAASLAKPRMHVGHRGSDAVVGAVTAYRDMILAALRDTNQDTETAKGHAPQKNL